MTRKWEGALMGWDSSEGGRQYLAKAKGCQSMENIVNLKVAG